MKSKEEKRDDIMIFYLEGKLVGGPGAIDFTEKINKLISEKCNKIVVDFSEVSYMNASGLGMLIAELTTVRNNGGDIRIVRVQKREMDLIKITKMDRVFKTFNTVEEAIQSFSEQEE